MYSKTFTSYVTADVDQYLKPEDRPYINRYFTISWPAYQRWQDSDALFDETLHKTFENFVNKALAREIMVKSLPEYLREKTEIKD